MKRFLALALTVAMLLSMMIVFAASAGASEEQTVIKYWYPWGGDSETWDLWRISEFEKQYPQYKVEATYVPDAGINDGKLMAAIASGDVPDVIILNNQSMAYSYAMQGAFEPLDDYLADLKFDESAVNAQVLPLMKVNGTTYMLPQNTDISLLFYRTDLFEEVGLDPDSPPKTIEELDEYADKLTKTDADGNVERYGFIPWLDAGVDAFIWPWQFGANVFNNDTNSSNLNSQPVIDCLKWQQTYAQKYSPEKIKSFISGLGAAFSPDHAFMTGKVAMTVQGNWFCNALSIYAPGLKYNVAAIPAPENGRYGGSSINCNVAVVPRGAANGEAGMAFAMFCASTPYILDDNNKQWRSLPIFLDAINDLTLTKEGDAYLPTIEDITFSKNSGFLALCNVIPQINDAYKSILDSVLYANEDPATLCKQADEQITKTAKQ